MFLATKFKLLAISFHCHEYCQIQSFLFMIDAFCLTEPKTHCWKPLDKVSLMCEKLVYCGGMRVLMEGVGSEDRGDELLKGGSYPSAH